jgi:hypothetical protein
MSKSENSACFHHVFANNFIGAFFQNLFQRIRSQREILRFLIPILNFRLKKLFWHLLARVVNFDCKCKRNGSKIRKIFFMNVS